MEIPILVSSKLSDMRMFPPIVDHVEVKDIMLDCKLLQGSKVDECGNMNENDSRVELTKGSEKESNNA